MDGNKIFARSAKTTKHFKKTFNNKLAANFIKQTLATRDKLNTLI